MEIGRLMMGQVGWLPHRPFAFVGRIAMILTAWHLVPITRSRQLQHHRQTVFTVQAGFSLWLHAPC